MPHRALSAEFALTPTAIQARYVQTRITEWRNKLPTIMDNAHAHARLPHPPNNATTTTDDEDLEPPLPHAHSVPTPRGPYTRTIEVGNAERLRTIMKSVHPRSIIAYTDGSETPDKPCSFAAILYTPDGKVIATECGRLSPKKTILDAETTAIYHAMTMAMNTPTDLSVHDRETNRVMRQVIILSDSQAAIHEVIEPRYMGMTAYLNSVSKDIEEHPERRHTVFHVGWIKGHWKIAGNEAADRLAKSTTDTKDPHPSTSPSFVTKKNSNWRQREWEERYDSKTHDYRGGPTRRLKKHVGLNRLDSTILFKIRSNKGWKPDDKIGIDPPPNCTMCNLPDDGNNKLQCPRCAEERPTNIDLALHDIKRQNELLTWIRHHHHFGIKNTIYEVRYLGLKIGNYNRSTDYSCPDCPYITTTKRYYNNQQLVHARGSTMKTRVDPWSLVCPQCGKVSQSRSHHQAHVGKHLKQDNAVKHQHSCPNCEYSTPTIGNLYNHKRNKHTRQKCENCPFTCEGFLKLSTHHKTGCDTSPSTKPTPTTTSMGTASYKCTATDYTYESPLVNNLNTHYRYNHRPSECHGCSRTFEGRKNLKIHERTNCGGSRS